MVDNPFDRNATGLSTTAEANSSSAFLENSAIDRVPDGRNACLS